MNEIRTDLCNLTYYSKLTGKSKGRISQMIDAGKLETIEVLGGTKLIKLTASQSLQMIEEKE